jgi:hypothetical protein
MWGRRVVAGLRTLRSNLVPRGNLQRHDIRFEFARGEGTWEVVIEGNVTAPQKIVDKLTSGKRQSVRVNGDSVTSVTWADITPKEAATA